jgi:hypothetical protein
MLLKLWIILEYNTFVLNLNEIERLTKILVLSITDLWFSDFKPLTTKKQQSRKGRENSLSLNLPEKKTNNGRDRLLVELTKNKI